MTQWKQRVPNIFSLKGNHSADTGRRWHKFLFMVPRLLCIQWIYHIFFASLPFCPVYFEVKRRTRDFFSFLILMNNCYLTSSVFLSDSWGVHLIKMKMFFWSLTVWSIWFYRPSVLFSRCIWKFVSQLSTASKSWCWP